MSAPYRCTEYGLDDVDPASGFTRDATPYGPGVVIDDLDGLHRAIARRLVRRLLRLLHPERAGAARAFMSC